VTGSIKGRDFLTVCDLTREEAEQVLALASRVKSDPSQFARSLAGQVMVMIFEKPSLRTRVTFEAGISSLGGTAIYLAPDQIRMGQREPVSDVARNLERWVQVIVARTFEHSTLEQLAEHASIPVMNALSDKTHPCQAFADFQTIRECFGSERIAIAYVGDGNNVCHSLMLLGAMLGYEVRAATPKGYEPDSALVERALELAVQSGGKIALGHDPQELVTGVQVIYTDVWTSMGQEAEAKGRIKSFEGFQVNRSLVEAAGREVKVMHCLPAHRGEEITEEVMDSPGSILFDQAENRLHAQKALLLEILGGV